MNTSTVTLPPAASIAPTPLPLPVTQETLTDDQKTQVEQILRKGPATNFDLQRELFGGNLNKESALAIKRYILQLGDKVQSEGQKRGRKYSWKS